jgi:CHAT domain-containing protein
VLLGVLLAGCQTPPAEDFVASGSGDAVVDRPAGTNLVGESCHYQQALSGGVAGRGFDLFCGQKDVSSGHILETPTAADAAGLQGLAAAGAWRTALDERFNCGTPAATSMRGGAPAMLLQCTRRSTGLPHLALVAATGGKTYFVEGVPSAYPALETAIAELSGAAVTADSRPSSAADLIRSTIARNPFGADVPAQLSRLTQLAAMANDVGDYASAERALRGVMQIQDATAMTDDLSRAGTLLALGVQVSNQDRFAEADLLFQRAQVLLAGQPDPVRQAQLCLSLAIHASNRGKFEEAQRFVAKAEQLYEELVPPLYQQALHGTASRGQRGIDDVADRLFLTPTERNAIAALATVERLKAYIAWGEGDFAKAATEAPLARGLIREAGLNAAGLVSRTYKIEGVSARDLRQFPEAESQLEAAIRTLEAQGTNEPLRSELLILLGQTAALKGDDAAALAAYEKGIDLAERLSAQPDYPGLSAKAVALYLDALDKAASADASQRDADAAKAYGALQLLKSDQTAQMAAQAFAVLSAEDSKAGDLVRSIQDADLKLKQLRGERDQETAKPEGQIDHQHVASLDQSITEAEKTRLDAEEGAEAVSPEYQQLVSSGARLGDLQKLLGPKEAVLLFFVAEKNTHAVLVGPDFVRAYPVPIDVPTLSGRIAGLRRSIIADEETGKLPVFDVAAAHDLYKQLLGPIEGDLGRLKKLVIAPGGPLSSLPFEVLVTRKIPPVTDGNYADVPFLVTNLAISYTPSSKNLFVQRRNVKPSRAASPYIGFADFRPASRGQLAASFPPGACGRDLTALLDLPLLPGTEKEVSYVGRSIFHVPPANIVLGAGFTKQRLLKGNLRDYRILHLATHALMSSDLSCRHEATIVVSPDPAAANADSAFLGSSEILSLRLDADLVVLSACNTGSDGSGSGDSLSSLARGFFYAGARGLLVTNWELSDGSGPLLTALTLREPAADEDSTTALQRAKLSVLHEVAARYGAEYSHPFHWAAFILVGDGLHKKAPST